MRTRNTNGSGPSVGAPASVIPFIVVLVDASERRCCRFQLPRYCDGGKKFTSRAIRGLLRLNWRTDCSDLICYLVVEYTGHPSTVAPDKGLRSLSTLLALWAFPLWRPGADGQARYDGQLIPQDGLVMNAGLQRLAYPIDVRPDRRI